MSVLNRDWARCLTLGLFISLLLSSTSPGAHGAVSPALSLQSNSLVLTVNPDRSVGVGWNTTSTLPPGTIPMNISTLFPAGYAIHSQSSFSQQANAVVQTSTVQYQMPQQLVIQTPLSNVNSITFSATQTGLAIKCNVFGKGDSPSWSPCAK